MARLQLELPSCDLFTLELPVRIRDINYGQHLSNDALMALLHEARLQWLQHLGFGSETDVGGKGLIMADAAIVFKNEAFHGDVLQIRLGIDEISRASFELYYDVTHQTQTIAQAKTTMVAYDYQLKKTSKLPPALRAAIEPHGI
ncbi:acyl-CoA thioesterase [Chitinibacter bivalviorum]|uniref:Acyl-CoA thioesterase n=1 Tax=Chitinibacter bivalviorum TaxID=2739434 RepID=A0A7H9BFE4_9NEIS|nr:thioesterase family protein [Chitinibacter bivalviorum]QLG87420.1 acyl-CoA thioesterase [Chitinibacter bivalviorum]